MASRSITVVGIFDDTARAEEAVQALRDAGFRRDQINLIVRDRSKARKRTKNDATETHVEEGALTGVVAGGIAGSVLGALATVALPGVGVLIATTMAAGLLGGAATGAAAGGLIGALIGLGIPEEEARTYAKEIRAGRTIITVRSSRPEEAREVLRRHGASGIEGDEATTQATATNSTGATANANTAERVEVREEELRARKQPVKKGEVRVRKEVKTEQQTLAVPVSREEVVVERRPADRRATSDDLREGQDIRIPVREEQVSVEKVPVVKEEITVGKRRVQDTRQVSGTVRKERAKVEREGDVRVEDETRTPPR
jgi:uncharacterized protein (TIGR02271 family)